MIGSPETSARRTVLVGWELGAGLGHLESLRPIVASLLAHNFIVVAAMRDLRRGKQVFAPIAGSVPSHQFKIVQAPIFLHRASNRHRPPTSLAEIFSNMGFSNPHILQPVVKHWLQLLETTEPDLIISDFAPSLLIAAAVCGVPVITTGNGWAVPPDMEPIPSFAIGNIPAGSAAATEARICDSVSIVTAHAWRPSRFAQLLRGTRNFIFTPPLLDPYRASRVDRLSCLPSIHPPTAASSREHETALIYLRGDHPLFEGIMNVFAQTGVKAVAYLGGREAPTPPNVRNTNRPIPLESALPQARFMVHAGGHGTSSWCLYYRVPQIVCPVDLEKWLTAKSLADAGAGCVLLPNSRYAQISEAVDLALKINVAATYSGGLTHRDAQSTLEAIVEESQSLASLD